jgi:putative protease
VPAAPATPPPPPQPPIAPVAAASGQEIGSVVHYWDHVNAAAVRIEQGELRVGDTIHVRGHTTDYYQKIDRMEVDHAPIEIARPGQQIGVHVSQRVREGDAVYKVS